MMAMENGGNEIVNLFLEAKLTDTDRRPEPNSNKVIRRRFAKEKYINQQYLDVSKASVVIKLIASKQSPLLSDSIQDNFPEAPRRQQDADATVSDDAWFSIDDDAFPVNDQSRQRNKPKLTMTLGTPFRENFKTRDRKRPVSNRIRRRRSLDYEMKERPSSSRMTRRMSLIYDSSPQKKELKQTDDNGDFVMTTAHYGSSRRSKERRRASLDELTAAWDPINNNTPTSSYSDESFIHVADELAKALDKQSFSSRPSSDRIRHVSRNTNYNVNAFANTEQNTNNLNHIRKDTKNTSLSASESGSRSKIESARRKVRKNEERFTSLLGKVERRMSMTNIPSDYHPDWPSMSTAQRRSSLNNGSSASRTGRPVFDQKRTTLAVQRPASFRI